MNSTWMLLLALLPAQPEADLVTANGPGRRPLVALMDRDDVLQLCLDEEVPVDKVNSIAHIFEDEHFAARGNLAHVTGPELGDIVVPGVVPTLSATPGRIDSLGPTLGNATDDVMRQLLGITAADLQRLRQQKII